MQKDVDITVNNAMKNFMSGKCMQFSSNRVIQAWSPNSMKSSC